MSVYQRSDGRWVATLEVGGGDARRRRSFYGPTRQVAEAKREAAAGHSTGVPLRFGQWASEWLAAANQTLKPTTVSSYEWMLNRYILPVIGHVVLADLTPLHIQSVLKVDASARTRAYALAIMRRALSVAEKWGHVDRNVARLVDPPRQVRREVVPLTVEEATALLVEARQDRLHAAWVLLFTLGLRRGEVLGLRWSDIDMGGATLTVAQSVVVTNNKVSISTPKSGRGRRLPLPEVCRAPLNEVPGPYEGLVFKTRAGHPIAPRNFTRAFHALCSRAGIRQLNLHALRHGCASFLLAEGVPPRVIMDLLGHSSILVTMNVYAHVLPSLEREAAVAMDALVGRLGAEVRAAPVD